MANTETSTETTSSIKLLSRVEFAKGCTSENYIDESKSVDSIERTWSLTTYDGEPDSFCFEIPSHWHKYQDEYMTIVEGETVFVIEGQKLPMKAGDTTLIPRRRIHAMHCVPGKRLVLKEVTDPTGDFKEGFFLDIFGEGWPPPALRLFRAFWDGDTYPALGVPWFLGGTLIDELFLLVVGGIGKLTQPPKGSLEVMRKKAE